MGDKNDSGNFTNHAKGSGDLRQPQGKRKFRRTPEASSERGSEGKYSNRDDSIAELLFSALHRVRTMPKGQNLHWLK